MCAKFVFKITVIGDGAVGKTSLINKYTKGLFKDEYIMTMGAQFTEFDYKINDDQIKLLFWDIAGQDEFHFLRPAFYEGSSASIVVFSLESSDHGKKSLENVKNWHNDFRKNCGDLPAVLFGNKADLVKKKDLNDKEMRKFAEKRGFIGYYKTSAKTGTGVQDAFHAIINELYLKKKK